eukprot:167078-Chlamydomonas_euryale.AAC.1
MGLRDQTIVLGPDQVRAWARWAGASCLPETSCRVSGLRVYGFGGSAPDPNPLSSRVGQAHSSERVRAGGASCPGCGQLPWAAASCAPDR